MFTIAAIGGYSFAQLVIAIIIIIAVLSVLVVFIKHSGFPIPEWVWKIVWIVLGAAIAIIAVKFLLSL